MTGTRGLTCPWQAMKDPFVAAVVAAHRWLGKGVGLEVLYPDGVPKALLDGLRTYESALDAVVVHDLRKQQEEREREHKKLTGGGGSDFRGGPPRSGRRR